LTWSLWFNFYRESIDTRPYYASDALQDIKRKFYSSRFNEAYDFVEFMADRSVGSSRDGLIQVCNEIFTRERSAFRFAGPILVRVTDENQRIEIASSIEQNKSVAVASHIARAAQLYSQQPNPDYRNSIKEAISAVEAAVAFLTGDKPSGVAKPLRGVIEQYVIHPALRDGFEKLYAYTSDAEGIRHALLDDSKLTQADARYMLVSCSAFANYLLAKKSES